MKDSLVKHETHLIFDGIKQIFILGDRCLGHIF